MHRTESHPSFQKTSGEALPNRLQQVSPAETVRNETVGTVRRKAVDVPSPSSEPILSQTLPDPEKTQRRPSPENVKNLAVTANNEAQNVPSQSAVNVDLGKTSRPATSQALEEVHPPSRKTQLQSGPVRDRSRRVGIDGERRTEKRTVPSRGPTERGLLPAHSSRAAVIAQPEATRFVEPRKETTHQPAGTNPTIKVTIGRVEVRAVAPTAPASPPPRIPSSSSQKLSLDDYLRKRNGRRL